MQNIPCRFLEQIKRTESVSSFRFIPQEKIDFVSGQFLRVFFDPDNPQNKELNKFLSFSCAPGKEYFEVSKKNSGSAFCQRLFGLQPDDPVLIKAPMGKCVLKAEQKKICFLIGGIGITPVISMLETICQQKLDHDTVLIYSNLTEDGIAFRPELDQWAADCPTIKVVHTVVDEPPKSEGVLSGLIDQEMITSQVPGVLARDIFIFGPPVMVDAIKNLCKDLGISDDKINLERFIGY